MNLLKSYNLSILAIPAFYVMGCIPHSYAVSIAANAKLFDNRNACGTKTKEKLKEGLSAEDFGKYERAEAAHANALENLPLFASAIIVANAAGLKKEGIWGLNEYVGMWFVLRTAHSICYIYTTDPSLSYVRSAIWATSLGLTFRIFGKAAKVLSGNLA